MLAITPQMRILVAVEAVDFRKGIDSLAELCRQKLDADPFSGYLFVFRSRRATSIKVLIYDGQGFYLILKRFSHGRLRWWPDGTQPCHELAARELTILLWNGHPQQAAWAPLWRPLSTTPAVAPGNSTATKAQGSDAIHADAVAVPPGRQMDSRRPGLPF